MKQKTDEMNVVHQSAAMCVCVKNAQLYKKCALILSMAELRVQEIH